MPSLGIALKTKAGKLTPYGLSCGYVELFEIGGVTIRLWLEHGTYHVRGHNHTTGQRLYWEAFPGNNLTEARRFYDRACAKERKRHEYVTAERTRALLRR